MDFVLTLHSHLPYVLNHGRWPHGSDWICEAALDTYLPADRDSSRALGDRATSPAPVTIGFTPVLANQLASPTFVARDGGVLRPAARGLRRGAGVARRDRRRAPAPAGRVLARAAAPAAPALPRPRRRHRRARSARSRRRAGSRSSARAATHGFLPLLARDESIRLQLAVGRAEHRRLFGRVARRAAGCPNAPTGRAGRGQPWPTRPAAPVSAAASRSTWPTPGSASSSSTAHLARRGPPARPLRAIRPRSTPSSIGRGDRTDGWRQRSPYRAYRVARTAAPDGVAAFVRDPRASMQVWSRFEGYPGDGAYLEFHKMRWPGGLKLWRVTGAERGSRRQGALRPEPGAATARAAHADHFAGLLGGIAPAERAAPRRRHRRAVRHRALRPLVVRGPRLPRATSTAPSRATSADVAPGHRLRAPAPSTPHAQPIRDALRLLGRQRRLQHVAQRADGLDLGAALAAGGDASGTRRRPRSSGPPPARCWRRPRASCCWPSRPTGSSSSRPAPRRTTPSGGFRQHCDDAEDLLAALVAGRRSAPRPQAQATRRGARRARRRSSPMSCPASPRRSRGSRSLAFG